MSDWYSYRYFGGTKPADTDVLKVKLMDVKWKPEKKKVVAKGAVEFDLK